MGRLRKLERIKLIQEVVNNMEFEDVVKLEMAIQGNDEETIERQLGCMSSNQWRECLKITLHTLITGRC